jgi:hypothetical protein
MASLERPDVGTFLADWIDQQVSPHPFPDDLRSAIAEFVERCLNDAAAVGISAADIESETGYEAIDLITAAFLARWTPEIGHGGSA